MYICPKCKRRLRFSSKFCDKCGSPVSKVTGSHSAPASNKFTAFLEALNFDISPQIFKFIISIICVVLIFIILISLVFTPSSENAFSFIKEDELFFSTVSKSKGYQATSDFLIGTTSIGDISSYIRISSNGKRFFFVDEFDGSGYDLYFKNTSNMKKDPKRITGNVNQYDINDKGSIVTYIKDGGELYQHNLKKQSEKIDDGVTSFLVTDDGKNIIYKKMNGSSTGSLHDLYYCKSGKTGELIATNIDDVKYVSDDLKTIYFTKNRVLYKLRISSKPEKIADGVVEVVNIYENGEAYYVKADSNGTNTLYYFDGKDKNTAIINNYYSTVDHVDNKSVMVIYAANVDDKIPYSYFVVIKDDVHMIEHNAYSVSLDSDGDELYFIADKDKSTECGVLYKAKISSSGIKKAKKVAADVFSGSYVAEDKFVHVEEYNSSTSCGEIYLNNKLIGKDINSKNLIYSEKKKALIYFTDIDSDNNATLKIYKGFNSKKVSDNVYVHSVFLTPKGDIIFLSDYSNNDATLKICKNRSAKKVSDDVKSIIRFSTNEEYDQRMKDIF